MGFNSVYRSLMEIFPQIDQRILRAVAIENPKDADEAAAVVLSEIVPSLPSNLPYNFTQSWSQSSGSMSGVERDVEDVISRSNRFLAASGSKSSASSSSETTPLGVTLDHGTSAPSTELILNRIKLINLPPNVNSNAFHKHTESGEVQTLKNARGKAKENDDFFGRCFDIPSKAMSGLHESEDNISGDKLPNDFWQGFDLNTIQNLAESGTSRGSENAAPKLVDLTPGSNMTNIQLGSCSEIGSGTTNVVVDTSKGSLASGNGDAELDIVVSTSTHGCSVDHLDEIIEKAKHNKKTLLTVVESVMNLMREVEIQEKDAEKSKEAAATGGLDIHDKVEELKKMVKHAKDANDAHAGEVYGEKSILVTELKELENRLFNLSEERDKSLSVLDQMRGILEARLAAAVETKQAAEQEKQEKEESALKALTEQEALMEKVIQESKLLQQQAEENSKLREFLMDRGQIIDSLQGEMCVICEDVKKLKEKFENQASLTKSICSSETSSSRLSFCGSYSSPTRSLLLENPLERIHCEKKKKPVTLRNSKVSGVAAINEQRDYHKELLEDGWEWDFA